ncbi:MAG: hypothetical protein SGPRY_001426 [Prymnesium sp.]
MSAKHKFSWTIDGLKATALAPCWDPASSPTPPVTSGVVGTMVVNVGETRRARPLQGGTIRFTGRDRDGLPLVSSIYQGWLRTQLLTASLTDMADPTVKSEMLITYLGNLDEDDKTLSVPLNRSRAGLFEVQVNVSYVGSFKLSLRYAGATFKGTDHDLPWEVTVKGQCNVRQGGASSQSEDDETTVETVAKTGPFTGKIVCGCPAGNYWEEQQQRCILCSSGIRANLDQPTCQSCSAYTEYLASLDPSNPLSLMQVVGNNASHRVPVWNRQSQLVGYEDTSQRVLVGDSIRTVALPFAAPMFGTIESCGCQEDFYLDYNVGPNPFGAVNLTGEEMGCPQAERWELWDKSPRLQLIRQRYELDCCGESLTWDDVVLRNTRRAVCSNQKATECIIQRCKNDLIKAYVGEGKKPRAKCSSCSAFQITSLGKESQAQCENREVAAKINTVRSPATKRISEITFGLSVTIGYFKNESGLCIPCDSSKYITQMNDYVLPFALAAGFALLILSISICFCCWSVCNEEMQRREAFREFSLYTHPSVPDALTLDTAESMLLEILPQSFSESSVRRQVLVKKLLDEMDPQRSGIVTFEDYYAVYKRGLHERAQIAQQQQYGWHKTHIAILTAAEVSQRAMRSTRILIPKLKILIAMIQVQLGVVPTFAKADPMVILDSQISRFRAHSKIS